VWANIELRFVRIIQPAAAVSTLWTTVHEPGSYHACWSKEQTEPKPTVAGLLLFRDLMRKERTDQQADEKIDYHRSPFLLAAKVPPKG
jgi:hypothetical protein